NATIASRLNALSTIGGVGGSVTAFGDFRRGGLVISFGGALSGQSLPLIDLDIGSVVIAPPGLATVSASVIRGQAGGLSRMLFTARAYSATGSENWTEDHSTNLVGVAAQDEDHVYVTGWRR